MKTYVTLLKPQEEKDGMWEIYKNQIIMSNPDSYGLNANMLHRIKVKL